MILTCPECDTRYTAKAGAFDSGPRKVRCAKCGHVWMQEPVSEEDADAAAPPEMAESEAAEAPPPPADVPEVGAILARPRAAVADYGFPVEDFGGPSRLVSADRVLSLILALIVFVGVIAWAVQYRTELSRSWPALAGLYAALGVPVNATGMEIKDPSWQIETRDGLPMLTVRGEVLNGSQVDKAVPRLRFSVRDEKGRELYHWSIVPELKRLGPGERHRFSTYLPSPPLDAHDIEIRFDLNGN